MHDRQNFELTDTIIRLFQPNAKSSHKHVHSLREHVTKNMKRCAQSILPPRRNCIINFISLLI